MPGNPVIERYLMSDQKKEEYIIPCRIIIQGYLMPDSLNINYLYLKFTYSNY